MTREVAIVSGRRYSPSTSSPRRCRARSPSVRLHGAVAQVPYVPCQCLVEQVRGVLAGSGGGGPVEVVLQGRPVAGVRAVVDDLLGAASRRQAAQVGDALFGDEDVHVVLG